MNSAAEKNTSLLSRPPDSLIVGSNGQVVRAMLFPAPGQCCWIKLPPCIALPLLLKWLYHAKRGTCRAAGQSVCPAAVSSHSRPRIAALDRAGRLWRGVAGAQRHRHAARGEDCPPPKFRALRVFRARVQGPAQVRASLPLPRRPGACPANRPPRRRGLFFLRDGTGGRAECG